MTIDECLEFADEWARGCTFHEGSQGWRVVCMLLAEEVRRLRGAQNTEALPQDWKGGDGAIAMNWKPPSITTRTAGYLRKIGHLSDADKLEYFDNIVGAAFRKGYNVRKGDELKMRGEKVHNV